MLHKKLTVGIKGKERSPAGHGLLGGNWGRWVVLFTGEKRRGPMVSPWQLCDWGQVGTSLSLGVFLYTVRTIPESQGASSGRSHR